MYDKASIALIPSGYRDGELYSVLPANGNGDFNFGSGSTATRVNKDGLIETVATNVPRLDYTGNVDCPHLLLEPSRTNLLPYSEDFSQWSTSGTITITPNIAIAPDGTLTADGIQDTTGGTYKRVRANISVSGNSTITASCFIKKVSSETGNTGFGLVFSGTSTKVAYGIIDSVNGTMISQSSTITPSFKIESANNDYWRFSMTATDTGSNTSLEFSIYGTLSSNGTSVSPGVGSLRTIWGAQLEEGSYPTSYIPTENDPSGVTRSADVCNSAGTSTEFNDSEGVLFAEIAALADDGTTREMAISDGGASNRIEIRYISSANDIQAVIRGASSTITLTYNVTDVTEFTKVAVKYKSEDYALWVGGVERAVSTTSGTPTGLNELAFDDGNGTFNMYGKCKQLIYFNEALSDSELQTLTS